VVQPFDREGVGERLRPRAVAKRAERLVQRLDGDVRLAQVVGEPVMAIAVELRPERRPGRHPQIAQAELRIDEVEVVMQARAVLVAQRGLARRLVVPGGERGAGLQRREDVDQAGMVPTLVKNGADALVLAEGARRADELDHQPLLPRQPLRILPDLLAQRLSEARLVEQPDVVCPQVGGHALRIADAGQRARDDDAIIAGHHARDLRSVAIGQQGHGGTLLSTGDNRRRQSAMLKDTPFLVSAVPS